MDEDVHEGEGSVRGRVFNGVGEVVSEGVEVGQEGIRMLLSRKSPMPSSTKCL